MNKPIAISLIALFMLAGCVSNSVPTRYYSLASIDAPDTSVSSLPESITVGVGPLELPERLDRIGIVSVKKDNELSVSTYSIWAGDLRESMLRVLTGNLSSQLGHDRIWSFPWDNRNRPEYQLRIVIEEFSGKLGDSVSLRVKWSLLGEHGRKELITRRSSYEQSVSARAYRDYVGALNAALNEFSQDLAQQLGETLQGSQAEPSPAPTSMDQP